MVENEVCATLDFGSVSHPARHGPVITPGIVPTVHISNQCGLRCLLWDTQSDYGDLCAVYYPQEPQGDDGERAAEWQNGIQLPMDVASLGKQS